MRLSILFPCTESPMDMAQTYQLSVYMAVAFSFPQQKVESKLKAQLIEWRFPCAKTVPICKQHLS